MTNFEKYNSIENAYQQKFVEKVKFELAGKDVQFIVQEKIHGANFSFHIGKDTNGEVLIGSRNEFIGNGNSAFYNHKEVKEDLVPKIKELYNHLVETSKIEKLIIFGELFGGSYPHKDIKRNTSANTIQKGIFYSPNNEFLAFDMKIDGKYVNIEQMNIILSNYGIPVIPILFKGNLIDCLNYNILFESTIHKYFNLPKIDNNFCEGVVIKPIDYLTLSNGSRIVFKNKNEKWNEKKKVQKIHKPELKLSENGLELLANLESFITESRFENVISKIGKITDKDFGKILGMYFKDAIEDFEKEFSFDVIEDKEELKKIKKLFQDKATKLIRNLFVKLLNDV